MISVVRGVHDERILQLAELFQLFINLHRISEYIAIGSNKFYKGTRDQFLRSVQEINLLFSLNTYIFAASYFIIRGTLCKFLIYQLGASPQTLRDPNPELTFIFSHVDILLGAMFLTLSIRP